MIRGKYLLPNGRVLRYSFHERLIHWTAAVSYIYLLLSGLAFWSPWLFWIAIVLGGGTVARELHPWFGILFSIAVLHRAAGDVRHVGKADDEDSCRQRLVGAHPILHSQ